MKKVIFSILLCFGAVSFFSAIMWTFTNGGNPWLWYSRLALGLICLGFCGLMIKDKP